MTSIDPRRDLWGALVSEQQQASKGIGQGEQHFLFVGSQGCGKSSLINSFFGRNSQPQSTLALSYFSCNMRTAEKEQTVHFWELGGGMALEQLLDSIVTQNTQKDFTILVCFDLTNYKSIQTLLDFTPKIMRRFLHGFHSAFAVGTHYDDFQKLDPSLKGRIVRGLRSFVYPFGAGLIFTDSRLESMTLRFRNVMKTLIFPEIRKPESVFAHTGPILIYPNEDEDPGGREVTKDFQTFVKSTIEKAELDEDSFEPVDPMEDNTMYDQDVDEIYQTRSKEFAENLKVLQASLQTV